VRLVTATNIDLARAMERERFREDLYHRINVVELNVPLRERIEDLRCWSRTSCAPSGPWGRPRDRAVAGRVRGAQPARWSGNVRELENVVQRALVTATGPVIEAADLPSAACPGRRRASGKHARHPDRAGNSAQQSKNSIADTLRRVHGDKERAARLLGISVRTLYRRATNPPAAPGLDPVGDADERPA
jgi:DNA-binding NtrC family response regulator